MAIIIFTGEILSFFERLIATGAIIRTVATLSINALTTPAKSDKTMIMSLMSLKLFMIKSASFVGIKLSENSDTSPIVPAIISRTLKSITLKTVFIGTMFKIIKIRALIPTTIGL